MFKYIKKLTSVVVMFAVIIVFSSSNVYADEKDQRYNPFFLLFANSILGQGWEREMTGSNTLSNEDYAKISERLNNILRGNNPYRSIQLEKINQKLNQDGDGGDGGGGGGDGH